MEQYETINFDGALVYQNNNIVIPSFREVVSNLI